MEIELGRVPCTNGAEQGETLALRDDRILYSETAGRLLVTVAEEAATEFESRMADHVAVPIGRIVRAPKLVIRGGGGEPIIDLGIDTLREAWKRPFGHLI